MKNLCAVVAVGVLFSTFVHAETKSGECEGFAVSAVEKYAKIFCSDYCTLDRSKTQITAARAPRGQDDSTVYQVQVSETIHGKVTETNTQKFLITTGYGRPPARFDIGSQCSVFEDISTIRSN